MSSTSHHNRSIVRESWVWQSQILSGRGAHACLSIVAKLLLARHAVAGYIVAQNIYKHGIPIIINNV